MARISYGEDIFTPEAGESVLDVLLKHNIMVPNSCRAGVCQSCLMKAVDGDPPQKSQIGLKQTQALQSYFLACQCLPESDITVALPSLAETTFKAEIVDKTLLCHDVMAIRLKPLQDYSGRAGQYLSLLKGPLVRSYSIANLYEQDAFLELHVRKIAGGQMSTYLHDEIAVGELIDCRGPMGDCFYTCEEAEDNDFPVVLAGTSTGLAPLEGVLLDALHSGHRGSIHLFHGVLRQQDLYHQEKLRTLAEQSSNFSYQASILEDPESAPIGEMLADYLKTVDKKRLKVYLCGAPELINQLKVSVFLAGVSSRNIHSDPFIMSPVEQAAD